MGQESKHIQTSIRMIGLIMFFALFVLICSRNVFAEDTPQEDPVPRNGIPLMIIYVDESEETINNANEQDTEHTYGDISQMNGSQDHSVRCKGSAEIIVPDGYSGGYSESPYESTTGRMELDYIRGRGNSTWGASKKPYKIKFNKKQDLLGMGKSKEWALMAESFDPTLMKNRISSELANRMGLEYSVEMVPVEVFMIGSQSGSEYLGLYNLSETIKLEESRIGLKAPDENNITGAYLMSIYSPQDSTDPDSNHFFTPEMYKHWYGFEGFMHREPEYLSENLTEDERLQREYIRNYMEDTEQLIMGADGTDTATIDHEKHMAIDERMDLLSSADYWWIQAFAQNTDGFVTSSTYFYKKADGKIYWGPLWDLDHGYGGQTLDFDPRRAEGFITADFLWIGYLRKHDPEFVRLLKDRWEAMDSALGELTAPGGIIDQYYEEVCLAQADDYQKWSNVEGVKDYDGISDYALAVERLKMFIDYRREWVTANLADVGSFVTVSFDAAGGKGTMPDIDSAVRREAFELPDCGFAPADNSGNEFEGWLIGDQLYKAHDKVVLSKDTVVLAQWKHVRHIPGAAVEENKKAATYSAEGSYDEVTYCTGCGKELSRTAKTIAKLTKKAQQMKVKARKKTFKLKYRILKKKKLTLEASKTMKITDARGVKSYEITKVNKAKYRKYFTIDNKGKITVRKGLKKGVYKVKVKVTAAGDSDYNSCFRSVTLRIRVK